MNPFQRARNEAHATRAELEPSHANTPLAAKDLLQKVESVLNIAIESVPPNYPDLGGGTAVLQREQMFIYVHHRGGATGQAATAAGEPLALDI